MKLLLKAEAEDPYNAELHYYLANSYVFLADGRSAIKEYAVCFDLEPLSKFGQYSRKALLAFGKKFQGFSAQASERKKHLAPDDGKSIKQAVSLIRAETCERDHLNHAAGESSAKLAVATGEQQDRRINEAAQELIDDLNPRYRAPTPALQEELHEIRQRAIFAGQHVRQDALQQASRHMTAAAQRSTLVQSSAASLLALIGENPRPGHIKVMAAGTNLYVRNYGLEPEPPLVPLMAEWEHLPGTEPVLQNPVSPAAAPNLKVNSLKAPTLPQTKPAESLRNKNRRALPAVAPRPAKQQSRVPDLEEATFIPGFTKVIVTDIHGHVLLHIRDDGSK